MNKIQCSVRLKEALKLRNLKQADLSRLTGISSGTLSQYITGLYEPKQDKLYKLSKALNVSEAWLMGFDVDISHNHSQPTNNIDLSNIPNIIPIPKTKKVPLLGTVACGEPIFAEEQHGEYIDCLDGISADFCLKCKGDSMINARIYDGDIVFIKKQPTVENGQIGCVLIENDATLKYVYIKEDKVVLRPANPLYDDMVFIGQQLDNIKILGRAILGSYSIK